MIKKIRNVVKAIMSNKQKIATIEQQNLLIESLVRENNWGNIFNSAISGSTWFNNIPLNVGRWAANYSLFYVLYRILNETKPDNILELGLGETTKMIQAYKRFHNSNAFCTTIEQSDEWIEIKLQDDISKDTINIIKCDVEEINVKGYQTLTYKNLSQLLLPLNKKFNLILIDGPWGSDNYSRYNIIELVKKKLLDEKFIIIIDDFNRVGEQETFNDTLGILNSAGYKFQTSIYKGEKDQVIISSLNFSYTTSL